MSHTSRAPRADEKHGVDYVFADKDAISIALDAGDMMCVTDEDDEMYGLRRDRVVDVQGVCVCVVICLGFGVYVCTCVCMYV